MATWQQMSPEQKADYLIKHNVVGNAYSDHDLWQMLYAFVEDEENPVNLRAACIRKMDELTGEPESAGKDDDMKLVEEFMTELTKLKGKK